MWHWLAAEWTAVRPNLEASAIWGTPTFVLFLAHHLHVRRSLASLHDKVDRQDPTAGQ